MDHFVILVDKSESVFKSVFLLFFGELTRHECLVDFLAIVFEEVERLFKRDYKVVAIVRP